MATSMDKWERITVDDLKEEMRVSDYQLNQRCTKMHLSKIALSVQNFNAFATKFGMPPAVLKGIETNQNLEFVQKVEAVFMWWHYNIRNATYRSFIQVCIELGKGDLAREMCELCAKEVPNQRHTDSLVEVGPSFVCPYCKECTLEQYLTESGCPTSSGRTIYPYLKTPALSNIERRVLEATLSSDAERMVELFADVDHYISNNLKDDVKVDSVKNYVMNLISSVECKDNLEKVDSMSKIFSTIRHNKSFFNFKIIKMIVDKFGSPEAKSRMAEYITEFEKFCQRSAFEIPRNVFPKPDSQTILSVKVHVKTEIDDKFYFKEANLATKCIASIFDIKEWDLQICSIEDGCVCIWYLLAKHIFAKIFPPSASQLAALKHKNIRLITSTSIESYEQNNLWTSKTDKIEHPGGKSVIDKPGVHTAIASTATQGFMTPTVEDKATQCSHTEVIFSSNNDLINQTEKIIACLNDAVVRLNDITKNNTEVCLTIQPFQRQQTLLQQLLQQFQCDLMKQLLDITLNIQKGSITTNKLANFLKKIENCPFESSQLSLLLKDIDLEIKVVSEYLQSLSSVKYVPCDQIEKFCIDFKYTIRFDFSLSEKNMATLDRMVEYLQDSAAAAQSHVSAKESNSWYTDGAKKRMVQVKAKFFKEFAQINSGKSDTTFVVTVSSAIASTSEKGARVLIYVKDEPTEFDLPSQPLQLQIKKDSGHEICLTWSKPKYGYQNVTSYVINYFPTNETIEDRQLTVQTKLLAESIVISDLDPEQEYQFVVQAKCIAGLSPKSNVLLRKIKFTEKIINSKPTETKNKKCKSLTTAPTRQKKGLQQVATTNSSREEQKLIDLEIPLRSSFNVPSQHNPIRSKTGQSRTSIDTPITLEFPPILLDPKMKMNSQRSKHKPVTETDVSLPIQKNSTTNQPSLTLAFLSNNNYPEDQLANSLLINLESQPAVPSSEKLIVDKDSTDN